MAIGLPVAKTLIEYNSNSLEENEEEEKEPIDIDLTKQKTEHYNDESAFDFKWSDVKEEVEEDIALVIFIKNYKSKLMRKIF